MRGEAVLDRLTGLAWRRNTDLAGPILWSDALAQIADLNRTVNRQQWRLPNIDELESLVDAGTSGPALPPGHPFTAVRDVYWSSTTSLYEPDWAWALYLDKGCSRRGAEATGSVSCLGYQQECVGMNGKRCCADNRPFFLAGMSRIRMAYRSAESANNNAKLFRTVAGLRRNDNVNSGCGFLPSRQPDMPEVCRLPAADKDQQSGGRTAPVDF